MDFMGTLLCFISAQHLRQTQTYTSISSWGWLYFLKDNLQAMVTGLPGYLKVLGNKGIDSSQGEKN